MLVPLSTLKRFPYFCVMFFARKNTIIAVSAVQVADLMEIVDLCYDNFVKRLQEKFQVLSGDDLCLCCLLKINVKNRDVAILLGMSDDALKKRKYRIKHEKIAMPPQYESLDEYLRSF